LIFILITSAISLVISSGWEGNPSMQQGIKLIYNPSLPDMQTGAPF